MNICSNLYHLVVKIRLKNAVNKKRINITIGTGIYPSKIVFSNKFWMIRKFYCFNINDRRKYEFQDKHPIYLYNEFSNVKYLFIYINKLYEKLKINCF